MESLLCEINKGPITLDELATLLDEFLMNNSNLDDVVYKNNIYVQYKTSSLFTDDLIIRMLYFGDEIINLFFAIKDRIVYTELPKKGAGFYRLNGKEAFYDVIAKIKNYYGTSGSFMEKSDLYEEVRDVDVHWITKRSTSKSAMN